MPRILPLLLALLLLAAAPVADAARRSGVDRLAEVRLTLDGRHLTATVHSPPGAGSFSFESGEEMWQRSERLRAVCGTTFRPLRRSQRDRYVMSSGTWPRAASHASFVFRRDISARVRWCLLDGRDGGDVAFVSFLRGEPRRRVAGGRDRDGRRWTLAAWRSDRLAPCVRLRAHGTWQGICFDDQAESPAQLDFTFWDGTCKAGSFLYGVAPEATAVVELVYANGHRERLAARAPAHGSRLRARLFAGELSGADVAAITALDAAGKVLAADDAPHQRCA